MMILIVLIVRIPIEPHQTWKLNYEEMEGEGGREGKKRARANYPFPPSFANRALSKYFSQRGSLLSMNLSMYGCVASSCDL